jgi:hypothetical protein
MGVTLNSSSRGAAAAARAGRVVVERRALERERKFGVEGMEGYDMLRGWEALASRGESRGRSDTSLARGFILLYCMLFVA